MERYHNTELFMDSRNSNVRHLVFLGEDVDQQRELREQYEHRVTMATVSRETPPSGRGQTSSWYNETSHSDDSMTSQIASDHDVVILESPEMCDVSWYSNDSDHGIYLSRSAVLSENEYSVSMTTRTNHSNSTKSNDMSCRLSDGDYSASLRQDQNSHDVIKPTQMYTSHMTQRHPRFLDVTFRSAQLSDSFYTPPSPEATAPRVTPGTNLNPPPSKRRRSSSMQQTQTRTQIERHHRFKDDTLRSVQLSDSYYTQPSAEDTTFFKSQTLLTPCLVNLKPSQVKHNPNPKPVAKSNPPPPKTLHNPSSAPAKPSHNANPPSCKLIYNAHPITSHHPFRPTPVLGVNALMLKRQQQKSKPHPASQPNQTPPPPNPLPQSLEHAQIPPPPPVTLPSLFQEHRIKRKRIGGGGSSDASSKEESPTQSLSTISDIRNATDASLRHARQRHSNAALLGGRGPLNSSISYPRSSTPDRRRNRALKYSGHANSCNRKLVFGSRDYIQDQGSSSSSDSSRNSYSQRGYARSATHHQGHNTNTSTTTEGSTLNESSPRFNALDYSGIPYRSREYSYLDYCQHPASKIRNINPATAEYDNSYNYSYSSQPIPSQSASANQSSAATDSDASGFVYVPMAPRPVTHIDKVKVMTRRKVISQQLKTIGRRIRKHGVKKLNMNTLAIL